MWPRNHYNHDFTHLSKSTTLGTQPHCQDIWEYSAWLCHLVLIDRQTPQRYKIQLTQEKNTNTHMHQLVSKHRNNRFVPMVAQLKINNLILNTENLELQLWTNKHDNIYTNIEMPQKTVKTCRIEPNEDVSIEKFRSPQKFGHPPEKFSKNKANSTINSF